MSNKSVYSNFHDLKSCLNCDNSNTMCGELVCRWHESYVSPTGKCSWWVKKFEKDKV